MEKPHSLCSTILTPVKQQPDMYARRFGHYKKGDVLPETTVSHSPRRKVVDFPEGFLKQKHIEHMEQNQQISSCCRHPENHEVEALKSHPEEEAVDIYIYHCVCGKKHRFFCVGIKDNRPEWK